MSFFFSSFITSFLCNLWVIIYSQKFIPQTLDIDINSIQKKSDVKTKVQQSHFLKITKNTKIRKLGLVIIFFTIFMVLFLTCLYFWMEELNSLGWELYRHPLPFQYILFSLLSSLGITKFISSKVWKRPTLKDNI